MMKYRHFLLFILVLSFSVAVNAKANKTNHHFEVLLKRADVIWGFDFLPDGEILLTERGGKIFSFNLKNKNLIEIEGGPSVYAKGQGGLLDIRIDPDYKKNHFIYLTYSEIKNDKSTTALGRGRIKGNKLIDLKKIFSGYKPNSNDIHFGSRIEFDGNGHLFLSMGDRDEREKAQDLKYHQGKILRLNMDGSVPKDNPFMNNKDQKKEVWSFGHRNPQGLALHPVTKELWEAEMGPKGGDEINIISKGKNYGWPVITYGREYHGPKIGEEKKPGMEQPIVYWTPSISPSGIAFYTGKVFSEWENNLFVVNLSGEHVRRLVLKNNSVIEQESLLEDLNYRWRNARTGPDGYLYLSTDNGVLGRIIKK